MNSGRNPFGQSLVLDAGVLLNLVATPWPRTVLEALGAPIVVADAAGELTRCPRTGRPPSPLDSLRGDPLLLVDLEDEDAELFVELLSAVPPDDLADSEAATVAYATRRGLAVASDEPKIHRLLAERFQSPCLTTAGIYRLLQQATRLGRSQVGECLFDSLCIARMRVDPANLDWSRSLLTPSQIDRCTGLLRG